MARTKGAKSKKETKTVTMHLRLTDTEYCYIRVAARETKMTMTDFLVKSALDAIGRLPNDELGFIVREAIKMTEERKERKT